MGDAESGGSGICGGDFFTANDNPVLSYQLGRKVAPCHPIGTDPRLLIRSFAETWQPSPPDLAMKEPISSCRPQKTGPDSVSWRVWAPRAQQVELVLGDERVAMNAEESGGGFFSVEKSGVTAGKRYGFSLDGGPTRPDPCTLYQPDGVHQASALFLPEAFEWQHENPVIALRDLVLYEFHIGTFTDAGTFDAAIDRLDDLVDLGVNALEVMPVAQFPGERGWGYDGVHPFATQHSYGGPEAFQRFIDAAHARGLMVILDVVFNHLGPEGNYLNEFGPYFTKRYPTPWGPAFNFDGDDAQPVRDWVLDCVWQWIHDFRLDGLRLDAVHAIHDGGEKHLLAEINELAERAAEARGGEALMIAESLLNDVVMVTPMVEGGHGFDAEWNDDFHHAIAAWMTGERHAKYVDYGELQKIATVFEETFYLGGRESEYHGATWGKPVGDLPGDRFIIALQDHDHIGNRSRGERIAHQVDESRLRLGACLTLLSPFLPMLFMGEEYGETNPFLFFCEFGEEHLIEGVRKGRKRDYGLKGEIPDPQAASTFHDSRLSWDWENDPVRQRLRTLYRDLIALRKREPALREFERKTVSLIDHENSPVLKLERGEKAELTILFHLGEQPVNFFPEAVSGIVIFRSGDGESDTFGAFETIVLRNS